LESDQRYPNRSDGNQLLAAVGILVALYILATFVYLGKQSQFLDFVSLQESADKAKYRHDFGAEADTSIRPHRLRGEFNEFAY